MLFRFFLFIIFFSFSNTQKSFATFSLYNFSPIDGLYDRDIRGLVMDINGLFWVGNTWGLQVFDGSKFYSASDYLIDSNLTKKEVIGIFKSKSGDSIFVFSKDKSATYFYIVTRGEYTSLKLLSVWGKRCNSRILKNGSNIFILLDNQLHRLGIKNGILFDNIFFEKTQFEQIQSSDQNTIFAVSKEGNLYEFIVGNENSTVYRGNFSWQFLISHFDLARNPNYKTICWSNNGFKITAHYSGFFGEIDLRKELDCSFGLELVPNGDVYIFGALGIQKVANRRQCFQSIPFKDEIRSIFYGGKNSFVATSKGVYKVDFHKLQFSKAPLLNMTHYYSSHVKINESTAIFFPLYSSLGDIIKVNAETNNFKALKIIYNGHIDLSILCSVKLPNQKNKFLFGTEHGLVLADLKYDSLKIAEVLKFQNLKINDIVFVSNNEILLATNSGLVLFNLKTKLVKVLFNRIEDEFLCLFKSKFGVFCGTRKNGVFFYEPGKGIKQLPFLEGLPIKTVYSITAEKNESSIWIGTGYGLFNVGLNNGISRAYYTKDGLLSDEFNRLSATNIGDTVFAFGTIKGINIFSKEQNQDFYLNSGQKINLFWTLSTRYGDSKKNSNFLLKSDSNSIYATATIKNVEIKVNDIVNDIENVRVRYKVDNGVWTFLPKNHAFVLNNPIPGKYTIEVMPFKSNSKVHAQTIYLNISDFWYNTIWGRFLLVFLGILVVTPFAYIRILYLKNTYSIRVNKTKNQIFKIIAHDLRSPILSFVGLNRILEKRIFESDLIRIKELLPHYEKLGQGLKLLVENLLNWSSKDTIGISPSMELIHSSEFIHDNASIFYEFAKQKNIKFEIIDGGFYFYSDSNLFSLVFRNLIDNALKNSPPNCEVLINFTEFPNAYLLTVSNNFFPSAIKKIRAVLHCINNFRELEFGLGLNLICQYATILKYQFNISIDENRSIFKFSLEINAKSSQRNPLFSEQIDPLLYGRYFLVG